MNEILDKLANKIVDQLGFEMAEDFACALIRALNDDSSDLPEVRKEVREMQEVRGIPADCFRHRPDQKEPKAAGSRVGD